MIIENLIKLPNLYWGRNEREVFENILTLDGKNIPHGQFAIVKEDASTIYLVRDRLGLNKLFYAIDQQQKKVIVASYFFELVDRVKDVHSIFSVPAGHFLKIDKGTLTKQLVVYYDINQKVKPNPQFDLKNFQDRVKKELEKGFQHLAAAYKDHKFFICLSGGLDSSIIADYSSRFIKNQATVVTFSYASKATIERLGNVIIEPQESILNDKDLSDDFRGAFSIAKTLGLGFVAVLTEKTIDRAILNDVLKYGQDWRDFNVHCAWVNYAISFHIQKAFPNSKNIFLTGDLMNEFVADYAPVEFQGETYYPQPRVGKERLRRFFVFGLDAGDREIGIFNSQNGFLIQPFSLLAELYFEVPANYLEQTDSKNILNEALLSDQRVVKFINDKKVRSQVGGKDGGTLGLFHTSGITQQTLSNAWHTLLPETMTGGKKAEIIFAGRYKN